MINKLRTTILMVFAAFIGFIVAGFSLVGLADDSPMIPLMKTNPALAAAWTTIQIGSVVALLAFVAGGDGPTADPEQLRGVRVLVRLADPMPGSEWKTADGVDRWSEVTGCAITSGYDSEKKAYDLEVAREDLAELRALPFGVCVLPLGEARP